MKAKILGVIVIVLVLGGGATSYYMGLFNRPPAGRREFDGEQAYVCWLVDG